MSGEDDRKKWYRTGYPDLSDEVERLRAVVAAQREALERIAAHPVVFYGEPCGPDCTAELVAEARAALDAEGVSEPEAAASVGDGRSVDSGSGSLTFLAESALREIARWGDAFDDAVTLLAIRNYVRSVLRTLDNASEEMSEPGTGGVSPSVHQRQAPKYAGEVGTPGSLTSPVRDTLEGLIWVAKRNGLENDPYVHRAQGLLADAEGVSESGAEGGASAQGGGRYGGDRSRSIGPGSLTSPVDTAPPTLAHDHGIRAQRALDAEGVSEPTGASASRVDPGSVSPPKTMTVTSGGSLTSPVDTAPGAKP